MPRIFEIKEENVTGRRLNLLNEELYTQKHYQAN
jgi:hypothetical protein